MTSVTSPRSRRFRVPGKRLQLTDCDRALLRYLVYLGVAPAHALYLFGWHFRRNASKTKSQGLGGFARRLTELFHAGYLSRFDPRFSHYVRGGASFIYCVESGRAAELARRGLHLHLLEPAQTDDLREAAAPTRARLLDLLADLGFTPEFAEARLDATARSACKYVSGVTSLVPHTLLAATWLSIIWFGLLSAGRELAPILPESVADLSFARCGAKLCGSSAVCRAREDQRAAHATTWMPIQPDCLFVANGMAIALEAETGQASRAKVAEKVERYLALLSAHPHADLAARLGVARLRGFHCVFHCATDAHAARVADVIAARCPRGTSLFLITTADDFSLDRAPDGTALRREDFLRNRDIAGTRLFDVYAGLAFAELFAEIRGRTADGSADARLRRIAW